MRPVQELLRERFALAIGSAFGPEFSGDPQIASGDPKFADYQCNAALGLSKKLGMPPREVAAKIMQHVQLGGLCEPPAVAGPGFINLTLKPAWVAKSLGEQFTRRDAAPGASADANRCGVDTAAEPQTVVVDYAGPNIAKQMHVGHLRSSIIGDTLARTWAFLGHRVVRQNHVGDFGTQFGMLIRHGRDTAAAAGQTHIEDLDAYYRAAARRDKEDAAFAADARQAVVALQRGDPDAVMTWDWIKKESRRHQAEIFDLLGVALTDADERGESFYKDRLADLVRRLRGALEFGGEGANTGLNDPFVAPAPVKFERDGLPAQDIAEATGALEAREGPERVRDAGSPAPVRKPFVAESQGALCVFLPGYVDKEGRPTPLIIQKTDGAFLYATTDLAAIYFRIQEAKTTPEDQAPLGTDWHADRLVYTHDARQAQHFAMVFDAARAAHFDHNPKTGKTVALDYAPFGAMLGADGKPFKTRSGETVKLKDLLEESITRAEAVIAQKNPDIAGADRTAAARAVGIGAVKYADLRQDRTTDYIFDFDRMLAFEGNTGPYLQYAYVRIASILRKAGTAGAGHAGQNAALMLNDPAELALAKRLLEFPAAVEAAARDSKPHYLCQYLFDLARAFSAFFERCPVLQAATPEVREARLYLCRCTRQVLRTGLTDLLGIPTLEAM